MDSRERMRSGTDVALASANSDWFPLEVQSGVSRGYVSLENQAAIGV